MTRDSVSLWQHFPSPVTHPFRRLFPLSSIINLNAAKPRPSASAVAGWYKETFIFFLFMYTLSSVLYLTFFFPHSYAVHCGSLPLFASIQVLVFIYLLFLHCSRPSFDALRFPVNIVIHYIFVLHHAFRGNIQLVVLIFSKSQIIITVSIYILECSLYNFCKYLCVVPFNVALFINNCIYSKLKALITHLQKFNMSKLS